MSTLETGNLSVRKTKSINQQKDARSLATCTAMHAKLPRLLNSTFSCTNSQDQIQAYVK